MAELESAEEFALGIIDRCSLAANVAGTDKNFRVTLAAIAKVEADRAAAALAAKRELLKEIASDVAELAGHKGVARGYEYAQALKLIARKYTAAEPAVETREW